VLGEKIEGRYMGGNRWFPAKISVVNRDGTYDIKYDDGDEETHVAPSFLRNKDTSFTTPTKKDIPALSRHEKYGLNEPVEARYLGGAKWYPGKISAVNKDGTYDVHYNDGEIEKSLSSDLIRHHNSKGSSREREGHPKASPANAVPNRGNPVLVPLTVSPIIVTIQL